MKKRFPGDYVVLDTKKLIEKFDIPFGDHLIFNRNLDLFPPIEISKHKFPNLVEHVDKEPESRCHVVGFFPEYSATEAQLAAATAVALYEEAPCMWSERTVESSSTIRNPEPSICCYRFLTKARSLVKRMWDTSFGRLGR